MLGWRVPQGKSAKWKEMSLALEQPDSDAADTDPMIAHWVDGTSKEMAELTVGTFRTLKREGCTKPADAYWSGEHCKTHHLLQVKSKQDRSFLIVLTEQKRQVLHLNAESFADEQVAIDICIMIGHMYSRDEIKKEGLKDVRNEELKKVGVNPKSGKVVTLSRNFNINLPNTALHEHPYT